MPIKHIKLKLRTRGRGGECDCVCISSHLFPSCTFSSCLFSCPISCLVSFHFLVFYLKTKKHEATFFFNLPLLISVCLVSYLHFFSSCMVLPCFILYHVANMALLLFIFVSSWFVSFIVSSCLISSQLASFLILSCLTFSFLFFPSSLCLA